MLPGITNRQAKYLASLQRKLGEPYTGAGLSQHEASRLIAQLVARIRLAHTHIASGYSGADIVRAPKRKAREAARRQHNAELMAAAPVRPGGGEPLDWQLHDLAVLARRAGEPTPAPSTRGDAARELARLRSAQP
jgi:hypothetical protein